LSIENPGRKPNISNSGYFTNPLSASANSETGKAITDVKHSFTTAIRSAGLEDFSFNES
jgi:hypothetical protein